MSPFYQDEWLTVYGGDCREVMRSMEPESVHCVVTSPPYWGLRDYGTATWDGGDEGCDHKGEPFASSSSSLAGYTSENVQVRTQRMPMGSTCRKCGAIRQDAQLGLEATPEEYVANMVDVFREVRRVLRADGTVWLNLGDSYSGVGAQYGGTNSKETGRRSERMFKRGTNVPQSKNPAVNYPTDAPHRSTPFGLKPKDLVGIPWRVAFALQADGWYLRSDIIWAKPNPMPESVTDRPTKSHEYLFLLSKSRTYFYDADAVAEPLTETSIERLSQPTIEAQMGSDRVPGKTNGRMKAVGGPSWQERKAAGATPGSHGVGMLVGSGTQRNVHGAGLSHDLHTKPTRNLRSVWTITTQPYAGAHYAVFPEAIPERCILAGTPVGGTVLDPFAGSGTVGRVAQRLSRRAVLIDLNPDYLAQAMARNRDIPLGLGAA